MISVIIPSNSDLIHRCVEHICSLNIQEVDYEIIICSRRNLLINKPNVKVVRDPDGNKGSIKAVNECFRNSQGEYFISTPDDLLINPRCFEIENFINSDFFSKREYNICSTGYHDRHNVGVPKVLKCRPQQWPKSHPAWNDCINRDMSVGIMSFPAGKRETVDNLLDGVIFNESFKHVAADNWLSYYIASKGEEPAFMPDTSADFSLDQRDNDSFSLREYDSQLYFELAHRHNISHLQYNELVEI